MIFESKVFGFFWSKPRASEFDVLFVVMIVGLDNPEPWMVNFILNSKTFLQFRGRCARIMLRAACSTAENLITSCLVVRGWWAIHVAFFGILDYSLGKIWSSGSMIVSLKSVRGQHPERRLPDRRIRLCPRVLDWVETQGAGSLCFASQQEGPVVFWLSGAWTRRDVSINTLFMKQLDMLKIPQNRWM